MINDIIALLRKAIIRLRRNLHAADNLPLNILDGKTAMRNYTMINHGIIALLRKAIIRLRRNLRAADNLPLSILDGKTAMRNYTMIKSWYNI